MRAPVRPSVLRELFDDNGVAIHAGAIGLTGKISVRHVESISDPLGATVDWAFPSSTSFRGEYSAPILATII